jgi:hypothetical protein
MSDLPDIPSFYFGKEKLKSNFEVIPVDILNEMINVCAGDNQEMLEKAKTYIKEHKLQILTGMQNAQKGLLNHYNVLEDEKEKNKQAIPALISITKKIDELKSLLSEIPDLEKEEASPGLGWLMLDYIYNNPENLPADGLYELSNRKLAEWQMFNHLLGKHELLFQYMKTNLENKPTRTKPITKRLLADYILEIAKLYEFLTPEKFTRPYKDGKGKEQIIIQSDGSEFVLKSMPLLKNPAIIPYRRHQNFLNTHSFPDTTFFNACGDAAENLKLLRKTS